MSGCLWGNKPLALLVCTIRKIFPDDSMLSVSCLIEYNMMFIRNIILDSLGKGSCRVVSLPCHIRFQNTEVLKNSPFSHCEATMWHKTNAVVAIFSIQSVQHTDIIVGLMFDHKIITFIL